MKFLLLLSICLAVLGLGDAFAQRTKEPVDTAMMSKIKIEENQNSQVMELVSYLTDVNGPRLTGTPGCRRAEEWAASKMSSWKNVVDAHLEGWGPWGKAWELKRYYANVITEKQTWPLLSYPKAWSPGTDGRITADIILVDVKTDSALETFRGRLKGKFVMTSASREIAPHEKPELVREADSTLLKMANADVDAPDHPFKPSPAMKTQAAFAYKKAKFFESEGAIGLLSIGYNDGGVMQFVQSAAVPNPPDTPWTRSIKPWSANAPKILPQIVIGAEHYNRLVRMMQKGEHPRIEMDFKEEMPDADSSFNCIAEIPGTDLKDEIVMLGGHIDSWHGSTGGTDNATGVAACLEALRILSALDVKPRRTIRVGLWSGEEQGEFGSEAYVKRHFGTKDVDTSGKATYHLLPGAEKFSAYYNLDNGTGKIRGMYMEGNEALRPIFHEWLVPFTDMGASTLTLRGTGSTDHESFNNLGLPGFQFIQDGYEYWSRSWHSTIDSYDRVSEKDLRQQAIIMAAFVYNTAMRDAKLPRKAESEKATGAGH